MINKAIEREYATRPLTRAEIQAQLDSILGKSRRQRTLANSAVAAKGCAAKLDGQTARAERRVGQIGVGELSCPPASNRRWSGAL